MKTLVGGRIALTIALLCAALAIAGGFSAPARAAVQQTVYVSPSGSGSACTSAAPCSLTQAQSSVQDLAPSMTGDIVVQLADGTYRLDSPLDLTAADSGRNGHTVIWQAAPNAHPVLSGAKKITGWSLADSSKNIWKTTDIPANLNTRQLYVNGLRAPIAQGAPPVGLTGNTTGYTAADSTYSTWRNPASLEFVYPAGNGLWTESRCRVGSISGTAITMSQPCWKNVTQRPAGANGGFPFPSMSTTTRPTRIENAYELLHAGQWYLDKSSSTLYYIPAPGQNMPTIDVEAPSIESLLTGTGTLGSPIRDITFSGLQFAYATWNGPSSNLGFAEVQANLTMTGATTDPPQGTCNFSSPAGTCPYGAYTQEPGNVSWKYAQYITFEGNTFTHLGAAGLAFGDGSQHNTIIGNVFTDISGIGVELGSAGNPNPTDSREFNSYNTINNNLITRIGVEYPGAVGILLFFTQHTQVAHNDIHDVPYSGISSGAVAGHADTAAHPNLTTNVNSTNDISYNVIYNYMNTLADGGAIYLEGHQNETVLNTDSTVNESASFAGGLTVTGNVVYNQGGDFFAYYNDIGSQWITYSNNVQWSAPNGNGGCYPVGHISFTGNYYANPINQLPCGSSVDMQFSNNTQIPGSPSAGDLPQSVLSGAGLEPAYQGIATSATPRLGYAYPRTGSATAGQQVLVAGSGFSSGTQVTWGSASATSVNVLSSEFLIATAPAGAALSQIAVATGGGKTLPVVDDTNSGISYTGSWTAQTYNGNFGNTQHYTTTNGDSFSYTFSGTGIDYITAMDTNRGNVNVYIDGVLNQQANCYAPSTQPQQVCASVRGLSSGSHTIKVTKVDGTYMTLDALIAYVQPPSDSVIDDTNSGISYTGSWTAQTYNGNFDDTQHYTTTNGDSFSYTFSGTGIDYITAMDTNRGNVNVYIDGVLNQQANCSASSTKLQQVCASVRGLSNGSHTIKVTKVDGSYMTLDALQLSGG
ncbi:right-handed parallel beta-helix repeat-containing protein [Streptomyces sp. NBC_00353]|uniref:IPT/TIG domain-containing protein n=1 Tax=Streptomyces sp. NBC_00353 TaxID=2975722 RepID=UPI002E2638FE